MKILFAVWEVDPIFKVGGLGDVARSLPGKLLEKGIDVRIIIPYYKALNLSRYHRRKIAKGTVEFAGKKEEFIIYLITHPTTKVPIYLVQNKTYIDAVKSVQMFAIFDKIVVYAIKRNLLNWRPDIIHCNDHHTGFIPLLMKDADVNVKTILTIHNLAHQGITSTEIIDQIGFDHKGSRLFRWEKTLEKINFLEEGIAHANVVTTVSPTYAEEIMTSAEGMGLDDVLRGKEGRLFGILNGIESVKDHPMRLNSIAYSLTSSGKKDDWEEDKVRNKLYLQRKLKLKIDPKIVMFGFVGRFDPNQKGLDIMYEVFESIDFEGKQFVILGSGDHDWEEKFQWFAKFYPKNVSCNFTFDNHLAKQIYAASDFLLVPSKYEPCGLIQMLAMAYGSIPIAHKTGGLADSIDDGKNGFLFESYSSKSMGYKIEKAVNMWRNDKVQYRSMAQAAFATDFSWDRSAKEYIDIYNKLISGEL